MEWAWAVLTGDCAQSRHWARRSWVAVGQEQSIASGSFRARQWVYGPGPAEVGMLIIRRHIPMKQAQLRLTRWAQNNRRELTMKAKIRSKSEDPHHEFEVGLLNAEAFLEAANRCIGSPRELFQDLSPLATPATVCAAFACEVALKCILLKASGSPASGHSLKALLAATPQYIQDRVARNVSGIKFGCINLTFEQSLGRSSNAFEEWRYHHEDGGSWTAPVHQFLIGFCSELIDAARAMG